MGVLSFFVIRTWEFVLEAFSVGGLLPRGFCSRGVMSSPVSLLSVICK